jgi:hypothetical protein
MPILIVERGCPGELVQHVNPEARSNHKEHTQQHNVNYTKALHFWDAPGTDAVWRTCSAKL